MFIRNALLASLLSGICSLSYGEELTKADFSLFNSKVAEAKNDVLEIQHRLDALKLKLDDLTMIKKGEVGRICPAGKCLDCKCDLNGDCGCVKKELTKSYPAKPANDDGFGEWLWNEKEQLWYRPRPDLTPSALPRLTSPSRSFINVMPTFDPSCPDGNCPRR